MIAIDAQVEQELLRLVEDEGRYLDAHKWDEWLALLSDDVVFWIPAWKSTNELTTDPESEVSLIYYEGQRRLEERVWRVRSGNSISSTPLARTLHGVSHARFDQDGADRATGTANWTVHLFDPRTSNQHVFFGRYEYAFVRQAAGWRIARKKIILLNDHIPTFLDFYTV